MTSHVLFRAERLLEMSSAFGPVLGIDTGLATASLGVIGNGRPLAQIARSTASHSANLPILASELLATAGIRPVDLQGIAAGIGPGSFTGLRIGLGWAKGMVAWLGCKVMGVPALDSMAVSATAHRSLEIGSLLRPVIDARKSEVYSALYRVTADGLEKISVEEVTTFENLEARDAGEATLVIESGSSLDGMIAAGTGERRNTINVAEFGSRGIWIAAIGAAALASGGAGSPETLEPLYVRAPGIVRPAGVQGAEHTWVRRPYGAQGRGAHPRARGSR